MIGAVIEGVTQSVLPCSWTVLVPSVAVGMSSRRWPTPALFWGTLWLSSGMVATGWLRSPPLWLAGALLSAGASLYWLVVPGSIRARPAPINRRDHQGKGPPGPTRAVPALAMVLVGAGTAWAWRPCVGPALGEVLNAALGGSWSAVGGLAAFLAGLAGVGVILGRLVVRLSRRDLRRPAATVVAAIGLTMLVGIYPAISSTLARWSTALWA